MIPLADPSNVHTSPSILPRHHHHHLDDDKDDIQTLELFLADSPSDSSSSQEDLHDSKDNVSEVDDECLSLQIIIIQEDGMIALELKILTGIPPALLQE